MIHCPDLRSLPLRARLGAAFAAGLVSTLAMPPLGWWPMLFAGLSLLYILLVGQTARHAFFVGGAFGFGYFLHGLYWVAHALLVPGNAFIWVLPLAVVGLPAFLALFTAAACWIAVRLAGGNLASWSGYAAMVLAMAVMEWLRGHIMTGLPWNLYGYAWAGILPMVQGISVLGTYGLGFLTLFWACLPGFLLASQQPRRVVVTAACIVAVMMIALYGWGWHRLDVNPTQSDENIIVRIVQPNIAQHEKWDSRLELINLRKTVRLSVADKVPDKTYAIVWPETTINADIFDNPNVANFIRNKVFDESERHMLLTGALRYEHPAGRERSYFNSLIAYDSRLVAMATYDKAHLVPFGEYIPLQQYIPLSPLVKFTGFTPGPGPQTLTVPQLPPFGGLICYEVIFPGKVVSRQDRPAWIVNVTNDAWYGNSPGPYQHLAKSVFRAVEEGLPMARAANTGISAFIDGYGRVPQKIAYGQPGHIDVPLAKPLPRPTFYATYGDFLTFALALGCAGFIWICRQCAGLRQRRNQEGI